MPIFRTLCNYYYIWPITLLEELKYIITSSRNATAIAKGTAELRSIVFYSREEREHWRQGPRCLRYPKLRRVGGLGGLMMASRRSSSGCRACIPESITRRLRGRLSCLVRQPSQSIHTSRDTYTFRRRFRIPYVFSWAPLLVGKQKKWYRHLQQVVQSLIPNNYYSTGQSPR